MVDELSFGLFRLLQGGGHREPTVARPAFPIGLVAKKWNALDDRFHDIHLRLDAAIRDCSASESARLTALVWITLCGCPRYGTFGKVGHFVAQGAAFGCDALMIFCGVNHAATNQMKTQTAPAMMQAEASSMTTSQKPMRST